MSHYILVVNIPQCVTFLSCNGLQLLYDPMAWLIPLDHFEYHETLAAQGTLLVHIWNLYMRFN